MIDRKRVRAAILMVCMDLVPPLVRDELLSDAKLRGDFGLELDAVLNFGNANVSFRRSKLFAVVHEVGAAPGRAQKISDQAGVEWEIIANTIKGHADLIIKSGSRVLHAGHLLLLTKNKSYRKAFFAFEADRVNLPSEITKRWSKVLDTRPLSEEEVGELMTEASHTPVAVAGMIMERLANANISLEVLVPRSLDYYERLVGRVEGQANIKEYADEVATEHVRKLLAWRTMDGLHQALLMGSHSLITGVLAKEPVSATEFDKLAKWVQVSDAISRGIVLELALRRSRDKAKIGANVGILAERFCGQGDKEKYDQFAVLSAAFVMVDGELGKTRVLVSKPPFWRRLAAFAHAALVARRVLSTKGDLSKFIAWMQSVRTAAYSMQCYVDLRREPRWLADFATSLQLKNEIGGRVLMAAAGDEKATDKLGLRDVLISDAPRSLKKQLNLLFTLLPGPLEGNIDSVAQLHADQLEQMRKDLADASPAVSSFALMASAALFFKLPDDIPGLAVDAIRRAQYRLDAGGNADKLESCLVGLATAAAINRSHELADELFIIIRNYRRFFRDELELDAAFRTGMIACASRADLGDWCKCVGALISDLGFGELVRDEAVALYPLVIDLCDLVPELWAACGQGIAAIEAVASS
jgi:hypothetical protein